MTSYSKIRGEANPYSSQNEVKYSTAQYTTNTVHSATNKYNAQQGTDHFLTLNNNSVQIKQYLHILRI